MLHGLLGNSEPGLSACDGREHAEINAVLRRDTASRHLRKIEGTAQTSFSELYILNKTGDVKD